MISIKYFITLCFILYSSMSLCKSNEWSAEEFLTGEFENNLGSHCKLIAKDGKITGEYFTKPSNGIYTPVKDGALISMIVTFKMYENNDLEKFSQVTLNGKVYSSRNNFKLDWLLNRNENEENEWSAMNIGQDHFVKKN